MRRICVRQDDLKDCGISALLTIIKYYHGDISKETLRRMTKTTNEGVSAYGLIKTAQELGFMTQALKGDIRLLKKSDFPLIAHIILNNSYQHFVVLYEFTKDTVVVADPSVGIEKISYAKWQEISTNKYLLFKPYKKIPKFNKELNLKKIIVDLFKPYSNFLIIVFLLSLLYTSLNIIGSYNFKLMMDSLDVHDKNILVVILIILIFIEIIKNLTDLFRGKIINYINSQLDKILINYVYKHIISLPYLYYKNRTCGDIITRINDVNSIQEFISRIFLTFFIDIILVVFVSIMLFRISYKLSLITMVISLIYVIVILIYNKVIHQYIKKGVLKSSSVNSYLVESINGIDTIKGLHIEDIVSFNMKKKYDEYVNINQKTGNVLLNESFFKESIYCIGVLIITFMGISDIALESLSVTSLITYLSLLSYYLEPIKNIIDGHLSLKKTILSIKRIVELLEIKPENFKTSYKYVSKLTGDIKIVNLTYSYNGIKNIFENVNMTIKYAKRVLIYGNSGDGKSTLMKIILKYLNDYSGSIYINNRDLNYYDLDDVRNNICYVSQSEILFTDSVYNNIVINRDIDYQEVLKVSKLVKADEFIKNMPLQYDTLIEENGFNLSGGEKQRIVLARTLLKKADIYIFDEALNAIDVQRERMILHNMFKYLNGKTIIVISHRFNNEDLFDQKINLGELNECWLWTNRKVLRK